MIDTIPPDAARAFALLLSAEAIRDPNGQPANWYSRASVRSAGTLFADIGPQKAEAVRLIIRRALLDDGTILDDATLALRVNERLEIIGGKRYAPHDLTFAPTPRALAKLAGEEIGSSTAEFERMRQPRPSRPWIARALNHAPPRDHAARGSRRLELSR